MGKGNDRQDVDNAPDNGKGERGGTVIAFPGVAGAPIEEAIEPEIPERSPHEELLGVVNRWMQGRVSRRQDLRTRVALRAGLLDFSRRLTKAVFCAEHMGYTPYFDESKGNAAHRLSQMQMDLRNPAHLEAIVNHFHGSGRGVMLLSSHLLTGVDPWMESPLQMAFMTAIAQTSQGVWEVKLRVSDDVYREEKSGRFRPAVKRDVVLNLDTTRGSASWPHACEIQEPKGILFLK